MIKTREHAESLGLADVWDREMTRDRDHIAGAGKKAGPKRTKAKGPRGENATEMMYQRRFLEPCEMAGLILGFEFIGKQRSVHGLPISVRRRYTPDYLIFPETKGIPPIIYIECKGSYYERAECSKLWKSERLRLELAAENHRAVFILAIKQGKSWDVTRVPGLGDSINVPADVLSGLGVKL